MTAPSTTLLENSTPKEAKPSSPRRIAQPKTSVTTANRMLPAPANTSPKVRPKRYNTPPKRRRTRDMAVAISRGLRYWYCSSGVSPNNFSIM